MVQHQRCDIIFQYSVTDNTITVPSVGMLSCPWGVLSVHPQILHVVLDFIDTVLYFIILVFLV